MHADAHVADQQDRIDALEAENADIHAENEALRERVAAIEAHVGLGATDNPGVRSLQTRTVETESQIEPSEAGDWIEIATAHDAHAAVAVPLERNGVSHGVLAVHLSDPEYLVPWRRELRKRQARSLAL